MAGLRFPHHGGYCRATAAMNLLLGVFHVLLPFFRPGEAQGQAIEPIPGVVELWQAEEGELLLPAQVRGRKGTCELLIQLPLKPAELFGDGSPTAFALQLSLKAVWSTVAVQMCCGCTVDWEVCFIVTRSKVEKWLIQRRMWKSIRKSQGHQGRDDTYKWARDRGVDLTMDSISQVIHDCDTCAAIKQAKWVKPLWYGGHWSKYKCGEVWQIDYITLPQTSQGKHYVLTMVEATTGWLETYPVPHATARNTILGLEKQIIWRHGTPKRTESDNDTHFKNRLINSWATEHGIEWVYHIPYHAPAAGKVERFSAKMPPNEKALRFHPSVLHFGMQLLGLPRAKMLHVYNPSRDRDVVVNSVFTAARQFHVSPACSRVFGTGTLMSSSEEPKVQLANSYLLLPHIQNIQASRTLTETMNASILQVHLECCLPNDTYQLVKSCCFMSDDPTLLEMSLIVRVENVQEDFVEHRQYLMENLFIVYVAVERTKTSGHSSVDVYIMHSGNSLVHIQEIRQLSQKDTSAVAFEPVLLSSSSTNFTKVTSISCKAASCDSESLYSENNKNSLLKGTTALKACLFCPVMEGYFDVDPSAALFHIEPHHNTSGYWSVWFTNNFYFSIELNEVFIARETKNIVKPGDLNFEAVAHCDIQCYLGKSDSANLLWQKSLSLDHSAWDVDSKLASDLYERWQKIRRGEACRFGINEQAINFTTTEFKLMDECSHRNAHQEDFIGKKCSSEMLWLSLQPLETRKVGVIFTPLDCKRVASLILIRNNLTILDVVNVEGFGAKELLKVGGRLPGAGGSLRFKVPEATLMDCRRQLKDSKQILSITKNFKVENIGPLPITISSMKISGYRCQGYGFEVLDCQEFFLAQNSSREISIVFTPDFTSSWVIRELTLVTAADLEFHFTLNVTLPHHLLPLCADVVPGPSWEESFWRLTVLFVRGNCKTFIDSYSSSDKGKGKGFLSVGTSSSRSQSAAKRSPATYSHSQKKHKCSVYSSKQKPSTGSATAAAAEKQNQIAENQISAPKEDICTDDVSENWVTLKYANGINVNNNLTLPEDFLGKEESTLKNTVLIKNTSSECDLKEDLQTCMFPKETNLKASENLAELKEQEFCSVKMSKKLPESHLSRNSLQQQPELREISRKISGNSQQVPFGNETENCETLRKQINQKPSTEKMINMGPKEETPCCAKEEIISSEQEDAYRKKKSQEKREGNVPNINWNRNRTSRKNKKKNVNISTRVPEQSELKHMCSEFERLDLRANIGMRAWCPQSNGENCKADQKAGSLSIQGETGENISQNDFPSETPITLNLSHNICNTSRDVNSIPQYPETLCPNFTDIAVDPDKNKDSFIDWNAACDSQFSNMYCPLELNDYGAFPEENMNYPSGFPGTAAVQNTAFIDQNCPSTWNAPPNMPSAWEPASYVNSTPYLSSTRSLSPMSGLFGSIWAPQSDVYESCCPISATAQHSTHVENQAVMCKQEYYPRFNPFHAYMNLDIWTTAANRNANFPLSRDSGYCGNV
ncbi:hypothetical protein TURU_036837 [Turdus rufiventris]|nr:hypothetical protein TURU_036837 [Turdus rufiventris]